MQQVVIENLRSNTLYNIRVRSLTKNSIIRSYDSQEARGITCKLLMITLHLRLF